MIRLRNFFLFMLIVALVVLTTNAFSANKAPSMNITTFIHKAVKSNDENAVDGKLNSTLTETATLQETLGQDGPSILQSRCTQCHTERSLIQINKNRTDWERALTKMERLGVQLSEPEKAVLLDYLAPIVEP